MKEKTKEKACSLCKTEGKGYEETSSSLVFCCTGCKAVYEILKSANSLDQYETTPLFQEALKQGIITNPKILLTREKKEIKEEGVKIFFLVIENLWCPSCTDMISYFVEKKKGIVACSIDYATDFAKISYNPFKIGEEEIIKQIEKLGYVVKSLEDFQPEEEKKETSWLFVRMIIALFCFMNTMMFSLPLYFPKSLSFFPGMSLKMYVGFSFIFSIPVMLFSAYPLVRRFFLSLFIKKIGLEALVCLSSFSAWIYSIVHFFQGSDRVFFDSSAALISFTLVGKILEERAKKSSKKSLASLAIALPKKARKKVRDDVKIVPIKEMKVKDLFVVYTGEKIPLDGKVIEGEGIVAESMMTGESMPIYKQREALVISGSILLQGKLLIEVVKEEKDSSFHKIFSMMIGDFQKEKSKVSLTQKTLQFFFPFLFVLITFVFLITFDIEKILSILFIACPCAIGIAVPFSEAKILDVLAKEGVIIQNRLVLPLLGKETMFVFDKTGTVTKGSCHVEKGLETLEKEELQILKAMTEISNHPFSKAIFSSITEKKETLSHIQEVVGRGIYAEKKNQKYWLGSDIFVKEAGFQISKKASLYFAKEKQNPKSLDLSDPIREEMEEVMRKLKPLSLILLSGDQQETVEEVAKKLSFDHWYARQNPLDKREKIIEMQKNKEIISMIGDGINDGPAITASDVSWAVFSAMDASKQSADIFLTKPNLNLIPLTRQKVSFARKIGKQNLFWAFFYNVVGLGLASLGLLSPVFSVFAMFASSSFILLNTKRID